MFKKNHKILVEISGSLKITGLPGTIKEKVKQDLTFQNKKYNDAIKYGRFLSYGVPKYLRYFAEGKTNKDILYTPKGYIYTLKQYLKRGSYDFEIKDYCITKPLPIELEYNGQLRPYQQKALDDLLRYPVGVVSARTGAGKTRIMISLIHARKQCTLVIVHSKELLMQWHSELKKVLGVDAGLIGAGYNDIKPITVGIINSVKNNIKELSEKFGMVCVDECHRVAASTFTEILPHLKAKYLCAASATVFRNDGLDAVIHAYLGPLMHRVPDDVLLDTGAVLKPSVHKIATKFYTFSQNYTDIIKQLSKNEERNQGIADLALEDIQHHDQAILIAVERIQMGERIADYLREKGCECDLLHGKLQKKEREGIVRRIKSGETRVLIATISLIGEGFDVPGLSSLLLASPIKFKGRLIQTVGRILRPKEGKTARVYDIRDVKVPILVRQGYNRDAVYRDQGWM